MKYFVYLITGAKTIYIITFPPEERTEKTYSFHGGDLTLNTGTGLIVYKITGLLLHCSLEGTIQLIPGARFSKRHRSKRTLSPD